MSRKVTRADFRAWNEEMVGKYDQDVYWSKGAWPIRLVERLRIRSILRLLRSASSDTVAEVGCGTGNVLREISGRRCLGMDISSQLLTRAREKCGGRAHVLAADAEFLPLRTGSVDRLLCTEVLEHVLDPAAVLREFGRVTRGGGRVVISVPNERVINAWKRRLLRSRVLQRLVWKRSAYKMPEDMTDEWHLHVFDRATLEAIIPSTLQLATLRTIPSRLLPIRFLVALTRKE
jgi:ubiquinone/menaquinone biosynthesis C-methylase UbiE